jgi:hypothetical protein
MCGKLGRGGGETIEEEDPYIFYLYGLLKKFKGQLKIKGEFTKFFKSSVACTHQGVFNNTPSGQI